MSVFTLGAWKENSRGARTPCLPDDPDASVFTIVFRYWVDDEWGGREQRDHGLEFTNWSDAKHAYKSLCIAFDLGHESAKSELREFLGIAEPSA